MGKGSEENQNCGEHSILFWDSERCISSFLLIYGVPQCKDYVGSKEGCTEFMPELIINKKWPAIQISLVSK